MKTNRIDTYVQEAKEGKRDKLVSIYFTAGYPQLDDTRTVIKNLQDAGTDMIEIGLPFSDPLADGPTIQASSTRALNNGMTTEILFDQLQGVRDEIHIPLLIMGYFNPILQYGVENFLMKCAQLGIDGLIIPDLPVYEYHEKYADLFQQYGLRNIFLITPQTSDERIRYIDSISGGFIYMVSSASTTGAKKSFQNEQEDYFKRIEALQLNTSQIVGFGISNKETFQQATNRSSGAIIGSAFVKFLEQNELEQIGEFVRSLRD